jgi:hypothetical protein
MDKGEVCTATVYGFLLSLQNCDVSMIKKFEEN